MKNASYIAGISADSLQIFYRLNLILINSLQLTIKLSKLIKSTF